MKELDKIRDEQGGCPTGGAVATGAGKLPAKYVFHAVGPVYRDGNHGEPALLASCYETCLRLAEERGVRTITFPAISTGVYGYPAEEAAQIAVSTVARIVGSGEPSVTEVSFIFFGHTEESYRKAFANLPE